MIVDKERDEFSRIWSFVRACYDKDAGLFPCALLVQNYGIVETALRDSIDTGTPLPEGLGPIDRTLISLNYPFKWLARGLLIPSINSNFLCLVPISPVAKGGVAIHNQLRREEGNLWQSIYSELLQTMGDISSVDLLDKLIEHFVRAGNISGPVMWEKINPELERLWSRWKDGNAVTSGDIGRTIWRNQPYESRPGIDVDINHQALALDYLPDEGDALYQFQVLKLHTMIQIMEEVLRYGVQSPQDIEIVRRTHTELGVFTLPFDKGLHNAKYICRNAINAHEFLPKMIYGPSWQAEIDEGDMP